MKTLIMNGNIITSDKIIKNASVLCENRKIIDIIPISKPEILADNIIDAKGSYISPGFIDTHIHGGGGCDVMNGTLESLETIASCHSKYGLTSFLPTTLTSSKENIKKAVNVVNEAMKIGIKGAKILGVHLEGPFIGLPFKGAQNPKYLLSPTIENYIDITNGLDIVKRVSMAPEIEGAFTLSNYLSKKGILVSVCHSDADYKCMEKAKDNGFSHITHMYNGMSGVKSPDYYCSAGVIESGLLLDDYSCEIICDGKHQPPEMIKLLYKCKGMDKMMLTTDATSPTTMPEGEYSLGGLPILVTDGVAMLADRTSFAGSVATANILVRNAYKNCGIPLIEAVNMLSLNVAKSINIDKEIGSIEVGKRADIILFDDNLTIEKVFIDGYLM